MCIVSFTGGVLVFIICKNKSNAIHKQKKWVLDTGYKRNFRGIDKKTVKRAGISNFLCLSL